MSYLAKPLETLAHWATRTSKKRVYNFNEGNSFDISILGQKGVSLCEMTRLGEVNSSCNFLIYL